VVVKKTCKECTPAVQRFCRRHSVTRNSHACEGGQQLGIEGVKAALEKPRLWSGRGMDKS